MRPLIGIEGHGEELADLIRDHILDDPMPVGEMTPEELVHAFLVQQLGSQLHVKLIRTEAELAEYQAGHIVLYRKPVRRARPTDVSYRRPDGSVLKREQTTLFGDDTT